MSHLSFVNWNIRVGTGKVAVDRCVSRLTARGWVGTHSVAEVLCRRGEGDTPWEPALAALAGLFGQHTGGRARVVLSNSLVRYAVLPGNLVLAGAEEERIFLMHRFRQLYGEASAGWQMRCEHALADRARLASAVDGRFISALGGLLRAAQIGHYSLVPALAETLGRYRSRLDRPNAWLVSHDDGTLCVTRWHNWEWMAARSLRGDTGWRTALPAVLAREECLHDAPSAADTVFIDAGDDDGELPTLPGWTVVPLRAHEETE